MRAVPVTAEGALDLVVCDARPCAKRNHGRWGGEAGAVRRARRCVKRHLSCLGVAGVFFATLLDISRDLIVAVTEPTTVIRLQ
eukprot:454127-Prorocentrum_minimum.AAC.4